MQMDDSDNSVAAPSLVLRFANLAIAALLCVNCRRMVFFLLASHLLHSLHA